MFCTTGFFVMSFYFVILSVGQNIYQIQNVEVDDYGPTVLIIKRIIAVYNCILYNWKRKIIVYTYCLDVSKKTNYFVYMLNMLCIR